MAALTPPSEILLRHADEFAERSVLFAGDIQDLLPAQFKARQIRVHTQQYDHWGLLSPLLKNHIEFGLFASEDFVSQCDTVIFYWPKNKAEAEFQLDYLFSLLPIETDIFIVGENRSGVRSAKERLSQKVILHKMDVARRCSFYQGRLKKRSLFNIESQWRGYQVRDLKIKTLPGVLGTMLAHQFPGMKLTLSDVNATALESAKATLAVNNIRTRVIASDLYSDIPERFNVILSNSPFHQGLQTGLKMIEKLIREAPEHLYKVGKLRLVANAFLPYPRLLDRTFGHHEILARNARFKVYQAKV